MSNFLLIRLKVILSKEILDLLNNNEKKNKKNILRNLYSKFI